MSQNLTKVATIVDIMRLKEQGLSKRAVAKRLGISRDTVSKYWNTKNLESGQPCYSSRTLLIDPYRNYITDRLDNYPELTAKRLYKEIKKQGFKGSERTVRRYVQDIRPAAYREYKPFETLPGEQAQVDWGHFGNIIIEEKRYKLYAFVFTLCWSRINYVEFVTSLGMASFLTSLNRALEYTGGVPREILFDNAKVVVSERVGNIVRFSENLLHFALAYGFTPRACWTYDAESKGKVESQVKYVRRSFFYALEFKDLADLNQQAHIWCDNEANTRIHGTTGEIPWLQLQKEQPHLKILPEINNMPFVLQKRSVTRTSLISVDGNKYSVPSRWARSTIYFRKYEKHLELLEGQQVVDSIPLEEGRGKCFIRDEHYPAHQKKQQRKTPSHPLQAKFEALAPEAKEYLEGLNRSRVGNLREQMEKIVGLQDLYPAAAVTQAMQRALDYQAFGYGTLKRILRGLCTGTLPEAPLPGSPLPEKLNVQVQQRDLSYYGKVAAQP